MKVPSDTRRRQNNECRAGRSGGQTIGWTVISLLIASSLLAVEVPARDAPTGGRRPQFEPRLIALEVAPADFELTGRDKLHLIVTGHYEDGSVSDVTAIAEFSSSNDSVVKASGRTVSASGNGTAIVTAHFAGLESMARIRTSNTASPRPVSFQYETLAALSKQGCNAGACHGSPSGKGGFRLSLRAFDAQLDELTLIREAQGRRTNLVDPESSLLLLKPLMKVSHGGGKQLHTRDPAYSILRDWIEEGCSVDPPNAADCVGIEVLPTSGRLLKFPARSQQLSVVAVFSDGSRRDVTQLAVFSSSDPSVATVSADGRVAAQDRGEATLMVRYLEFIESCLLTFVKDIDGFEWSAPPVYNYVDQHVHDKLRQLQYLPSGLSTDSEFLRRVYLDAIGVLPTTAEVSAFLSDPAPTKRSILIDALLERPEYAKFWALKWGDLLRVTSSQVGADGVHKYHRWLERSVESNLPYDQFAQELLTASGSTMDNPAANFYRTASDMNECVETVSQLFLGARLQCAKCHNHPFERWTQDNYFGMGAFFHRVKRMKTRRPDELFIWSDSSGEVTQPRTGEQMRPWVPVAGELPKIDSTDRRRSFAEWLTGTGNPFFAKVEVNRIWSHLLGRGIVDPPDDFRESNPPSNRALLEALAADFIDHGYDRKHAIRTILNSATYQSSIRPNHFNRDETKYFSHYQPRLLTAEQLLDAICHVTGMPETFGNLPPGTKATHLPAPDLTKHEFLRVFGQPARQTACECERTTDSNLGMAIEFLNGPLIHGKLQSAENRLRDLVHAGSTDAEIISALHLSAVSRLPSSQELHASQQHIASQAAHAQQANQQIDSQLAGLRIQSEQLRGKVREELAAVKLASLPDVLREDTARAFKTAPQQRDDIQAYLADRFSATLQVNENEIVARLSDPERKTLESLDAKLANLESTRKSAQAVRLDALEDICWVLLNQNEFLFNH